MIKLRNDDDNIHTERSKLGFYDASYIMQQYLNPKQEKAFFAILLGKTKNCYGKADN